MASATMQILLPEILRIQGRRYRMNPYTSPASVAQQNEEPRLDTYVEEADYSYFEETESCASELGGVEKTDGKYTYRMKDVPSYYFGNIVGKEGRIRKSLESQTKTSIVVPKRNEEGDIVITGRERTSVLSAKTRIQLLIEDARKMSPGTHFLSIPLISDEISQNFQNFKEAVLQTCEGSRGLDASIFQLPARLHLTLGLLTLHSENELAQVNRLLSEVAQPLIEKYVGCEPFRLQMVGIEYMNDDPGEVDVLYAKIQLDDGSNRLQEFVDDLIRGLEPSGFLKREGYDHVKLHATIMNTIFRDNREEENSRTKLMSGKAGPYKKIRVTFDASEILRVFGDFDFGELHIGLLHLSQRGQYGPSGYYRQVASIDLAQSPNSYWT